MSTRKKMGVDYDVLNRTATAAGQEGYVDPVSGYLVFSSLGLKNRGSCCGSGCRHCPFDHEKVPAHQTAPIESQAPHLLCGTLEQKTRHAFSWSGGKDSFLALCKWLQNELPVDASPHLIKTTLKEAVLLTTYDAKTRKIAHQNLWIDDVLEQAQVLELPLIGIPLQPGHDYVASLRKALQLLPASRVLQQSSSTAQQTGLSLLHFGDLHLQHIVDWRKQSLLPLAQEFGAKLSFPLLHQPYSELCQLWQLTRAQASISASNVASVKIGQAFNAKFMRHLPKNVDQFGENGEFHTRLQPYDSAAQLSLRLTAKAAE